jgi:hypothetical protein
MSRDIAAIRAAAQDDETRHYQALMGPAHRRLIIKGWEQRFQADDGLGCWDQPTYGLRLIHSIARGLDGDVWAHVSVSRRDGQLPTWRQLSDTWRLLYPELVAVQVIAPADRHVNLAEVAHAWGNLGRPAVPDFTHGLGTI